jgi:class 3 adenylate cyclase
MGLPTGTVTLLFSDMEGSTRLLSRLGASYGDLLSAQRSLLRSVFGAHHGTEMGTEGDSFYVAGAGRLRLAARRGAPDPDGPAYRGAHPA